ncbi:MAG: hypothetical protein LBS19_15715 [Clostridiales bacterium]|nr:hypothetical protein [Clostridiales bacterium]
MFCIKCGNQLREGSGFCDRCGAPVANPPTQAAPAPEPQRYIQPPAQTERKKPVMLIIILVLVALVGILLALLFLNMGGNEEEESSAPRSSSSLASSSTAASNPAEGEDEREASEAWKRPLFEWVQEQHGHIEASANRGNSEEGSYTITLFEYGEDRLVGFTWNQSNEPVPDDRSIVYVFDGDWSPGVDGYDLNRLYRNTDTDVADMLRSVNHNGVDSFYLDEDGKWVRQFSINPEDGVALAYAADETYREIPMREAESMREEILSVREEVTGFQQYTVLIEGESKGRVAPWGEIAGAFGAWLNDYDGVAVDLAVEEDSSEEEDRPSDSEEQEREASEAWKRPLYEWLRAEYGSMGEIPENMPTYSISLLEYGENGDIGFFYATGQTLAGGHGATKIGGSVYILENGSFVKLADGEICTLYRNTETGVIDLLRFEVMQVAGVSFYTLEDGEWHHCLNMLGIRQEGTFYGVDGTELNLTYSVAVTMGEDLVSGHEEVMDLPGFTIEVDQNMLSWAEIAAEFSMWLDNYDGIMINLAGEEDFSQAEAKPQQVSADWADAYANVVATIRQHQYYGVYSRGLIAVSFTLTDINFDGTPELLYQRSLVEAIDTNIISVDIAADMPRGSQDDLEGFFIDKTPSISSLPLRYFASNSGEIIFSTLLERPVHVSIDYFRNSNYACYRKVICSNYLMRGDLGEDLGGYYHILADGENNVIEKVTAPDTNMYGHDPYECDIGRGLNSSDPTIVRLVQKALEGYSEITAPKQYTYKVPMSAEGRNYYDIADVQNWIYEAAANY